MEQQNEQPIEPVQNSKNIWIIVATIVVTTLVVGSTVYAWQKSNLKSTKQKLQKQITYLQDKIIKIQLEKNREGILDADVKNIQPPNQKQTQPAEITNKGNGWKKYHNLQYNFSINYPDSWVVEEDDDPCCSLLAGVYIKSSNNTGCTCGGPSLPDVGHMITIWITKNNDNKTLADLKQQKEKVKCSTVEIKKINDLDALFYKGCPDCCAYFPGFKFIRGEYIYEVYSSYFPDTNNFDKLFENMIKTIKFDE